MAQRPTGGRSRAAVFLLISAVAASLAVLVIYRLIASYQAELAEATRPPETVPVVVAKATLFQGQTLTENDLEIREVQPEFVPETVYRDKADVLGRVPLERIIQGEFVRVERLAEPTAGVGLNALIPQGHRALSINITDGSAVSGFLNPGNYVDVLVTVSADSPDKKSKAKKVKQTVTMLQARKVLAVDNRIGGDATAGESGKVAPSVTLALTPEEAEKVTHANTEGKVTLTLRNDVDVTQVETNGARAAKLVGKEPVVEFKPPPKKTPAPKKPEEQSIQIIKGTKVQVEKQPGGK